MKNKQAEFTREQVELLLQHQIENVRQFVDRCARDAGAVRTDFDTWIKDAPVINLGLYMSFTGGYVKNSDDLHKLLQANDKPQLCDGCNVRGNFKHRCNGFKCDCERPICRHTQGKITQEQLMDIVNNVPTCPRCLSKDTSEDDKTKDKCNQCGQRWKR